MKGKRTIPDADIAEIRRMWADGQPIHKIERAFPKISASYIRQVLAGTVRAQVKP
jgi:hypothetical protein